MPRSPRAYLIDVIDACDAIAAALRKVELSRYESDRLIRSAVEREFILIGEALASLARLDASLTARISNVRMVVGFRNLLTHGLCGRPRCHRLGDRGARRASLAR